MEGRRPKTEIRKNSEVRGPKSEDSGRCVDTIRGSGFGTRLSFGFRLFIRVFMAIATPARDGPALATGGEQRVRGSSPRIRRADNERAAQRLGDQGRSGQSVGVTWSVASVSGRSHPASGTLRRLVLWIGSSPRLRGQGATHFVAGRRPPELRQRSDPAARLTPAQPGEVAPGRGMGRRMRSPSLIHLPAIRPPAIRLPVIRLPAIRPPAIRLPSAGSSAGSSRARLARLQENECKKMRCTRAGMNPDCDKPRVRTCHFRVSERQDDRLPTRAADSPRLSQRPARRDPVWTAGRRLPPSRRRESAAPRGAPTAQRRCPNRGPRRPRSASPRLGV